MTKRLSDFILNKNIITKLKKQFSYNRWCNDQGDKTLRLNYVLDENSVVFDLGGYEGQWASDIFSKYHPKIYIFEPIPEFADGIRKRFEKNEKVIVFNFGLSNYTNNSIIYLSKDGTSLYNKKGNLSIDIKIVRAIDFLADQKISHINLIKINIEGAEFDLLEDLISSNFIKDIDNIQIQFHEFVPDARERMKFIQRNLLKTHHLTYQYPFIWENWEKNSFN
jgi:FkbM family methyltransferase